MQMKVISFTNILLFMKLRSHLPIGGHYKNKKKMFCLSRFFVKNTFCVHLSKNHSVKNILIAINALLLLSVAFLYYKQFSGTQINEKSNSTTDSSVVSDSFTMPVPNITSLPKGTAVVFFNSDSIFEHYEYAKKMKVHGESKIENARKALQAKETALQNDYADYMEKAQKGMYTREEGLKIEEDLKRRYEEIIKLTEGHDKMLEQIEASNQEVLKKIYDYVSRFNKKHGYVCALAYSRSGGVVVGVNDSLDVTRQIVEGLNAEYKATQNNK
jgi:outer membrane protein